MPNNSPTIVAASLSDQILKDSIKKLVDEVNGSVNKMAENFNTAIGSMEAKLKSLGNVKIDFGGTSSGGGTKKVVNDQKELEEQTKKTTQAAKEQKMTFDQTAQSQQVAIRSASNSFRNADTLQMMQTNLDLLKEKLREARQQYSSFIALAAQATTTGDKGLYQFATSGVHQYEQEVKSLIPQIRSMQTAIQQMGDVIAPQGHTIQNYVNTIGKATPELKQLGEQIKNNAASVERDNASMSEAASSANRYTEAIRRQAQAIRESVEWKEKGYAMVGDRVYYDSERSTLPAKDRLSLEEQILNTQKEQEVEAIRRASAERQEASEKAAAEQAAQRQLATETQITNEQAKRSQPKTFASYDDLRQSIAHVLGLQQSQVKLADSETASYNNLDKTLRQLKQTYDRLSSSERDSDQGKALVASIQEVERAIQKIRLQASRPVSLESILGINGRGGLSEKTLDDIAYKMQRLASYRSGLDVNAQRNEINQVNAEYERLKKKMDEVMNKNQQMVGSNNALGRSWNYMKNRLAFYFSVGASTAFIKNLIEVRSQYEMNERALGILINSAERGTQIFNELSQMALVSPYTLIELSTAAKQLTAYDVAAKDVVDTTRRLADMAAAVGIPIERLTYALGQIKAYGYLNSRDARMFANAGIPLVKQLSEYYTELEGKLVSTADVYDRIKKKAIDYNEVMEVINKMTDEGGKFFDFQAKMADTLKVRLANLTLAWNNMLNDIGKSQQGVLTWGIGALRELFLQWKNINDILSNISWAVGLRTATMLLVWSFLKLGNAIGFTTKQMSLSAVFGAKLARILRTVGNAMLSIVKNPLTWWSLLAVAAIDAAQALLGVNEAQKALNESIRNGAKDNYNNISKFLEQYKDVRESLYETRKVAIGNIYDPSSRKAAATAYSEESFTKDINNNEAKKAWEAIREQIELTTASSDKYISNLLKIGNMSERVRKGFEVLEDIKTVNAALKELSDDTIKIEKELSGWWNAYMLPDGLVGNLKDYTKQLGYIEKNWGSLENATKRGSTASEDAILNLDRELNQFREDLKVTTDSIINFIELKGWSGDVNKINETFNQITQKLVLDNQLDPQKAFILQTEVEEARSEAAKKALLQRINDEKAALAQTADEESRSALVKSINDNVNEYNTWNEFNGRKKVEWERFTKWLKEQHISETTAMFRNMDAEDIRSLNFQEGKHAEWVTRMVTQYAKEHKMSYDEAFNYLKSWVKSANQWSVFIPLIISTEDKKSIYDQLGEYDKLVDEADAQIERLGKRIGELKAKKELDKKETEELAKAEQELADAQKSKADAEAHGGHGKKEKKDERAAAKAQKQAESELQKALKEELQLIDKVRSQYKKLTDAGVSRAVAMKTVTEQFGDSIKHINAVLGRNGLPKFDIKSFAGTDNPHEMMVMLKKQIDSAKKVKNIKPEEIKDLEIKYSEIKVDAEAYDATKIKKGLDNELGRLKDEYELAVELDANPELGNMFADMFDIDLDTLPRTAKEYAERYTKSLNKYFKAQKANIELPNMLNLTRDDMAAFQEQFDSNQLQQVYFDLIQKGYEATQEARKKESTEAIKEYDKLLQKYAEYQYKLTRIAKEANNERKALVVKFGTDEQKESARKIYAQLEIEDDPKKAEELREQLKALVDQVVGDDQVRIQLKVAIDKKEVQESAKAAFEEFQKSPEWIVATGDLAGMTNNAIGGLIDSLEKYKKTARNLDPKQIKQINNALKNLYKQQRSGNPFNAIGNAIDEARMRAAEFQPEIEKVEKRIYELSNSMDESNLEKNSGELTRLVKRLQELKKAQKEAGKVSAKDVVDGINSAVSAARTATDMFGQMADALGGKGMTKAAQTINKVVNTLQMAGSGAAIGAQIGSGYGAIIGAVVGGVAGIVTNWSDEISGNADITDAVNESIKAVKLLDNTYKNLSYTVERAYGVNVSGAQASAQANKELALAELRRQLELEKSRKSKNRDEDKIADLEGQIIELKNEIDSASKEIISDLLGISSSGDEITSLVQVMIDAFKNGEDAMKAFGEEWDKMIDNMILKLIVSTYMQQAWDNLMSILEDKKKEFLKRESEERSSAQQAYDKAAEMTDDEIAKEIAKQLGYKDSYGYGKKSKEEFENEMKRGVLHYSANQSSTGIYYWIYGWQKVADEEIAAYRKMLEQQVKATSSAVDSASMDFTQWSLDYMNTEGREYMERYAQMIKDSLGDWYTYGESANKELSALQQGIQGITEDTAGAIEAYLNIVSQQIFLHTDLITQIRDAVVSMSGGDLVNGIQAQMLLQLQQSYQVQMTVQGILEGWSSPSGQSVRVELIS